MFRKAGDLYTIRREAVSAKCLLVKQEVCQDKNRLDLDDETSSRRGRKEEMRKKEEKRKIAIEIKKIKENRGTTGEETIRSANLTRGGWELESS